MLGRITNLNLESNLPRNEAWINNEVVGYDACSSYNFERAKKYYEEIGVFRYIGSGFIYSVRGHVQTTKDRDDVVLHHFFVRN